MGLVDIPEPEREGRVIDGAPCQPLDSLVQSIAPITHLGFTPTYWAKSRCSPQTQAKPARDVVNRQEPRIRRSNDTSPSS
jgi:hypothetical protein